MSYTNLPRIEPGDMPTTEYGALANLKVPLAKAINEARMMQPVKMEDIIATLQFCLDHIQGKDRNETTVSKSAGTDPLDELLGPAGDAEGAEA